MFGKSKSMKKNKENAPLEQEQKNNRSQEKKKPFSKNKASKKTKNSKIKNRTVLSLDFGSHEIKGVYGKVENNKVLVNSIFKGSVENSWYRDGRVENMDAAKNNMINILKKNKIKNTDAVCTVESTDIIKREITIPKVEEKDILPLINYEIGQYLPIDIDSYVIQYKVLSEFVENDLNKLQVLVTAMPKPIVENLLQLVQSCQLTPYVLDVHFNSLEKLIQMEIACGTDGRNNWDKNVALVDFGVQKTNITLFSNGKYAFNSIIDYGEKDLYDIVKSKCNEPNRLSLDEIHHIMDGMFVSFEPKKAENIGESEVEAGHENLSQEYPYLNTKTPVAPYGNSEQGINTFEMTSQNTLTNEVDKIVQETGIESLRQTYMNFSNVADLNQSMVRNISQLADEINKTIRYFAMKKVQNQVDKIYLYGGSSKIKGLEAFLENHCDISTENVPRLYCVQLNKSSDFDVSQYLNALGAIIRL